MKRFQIVSAAALVVLGGVRPAAAQTNTGTGYHALYALTTGDSNTGMGYTALRKTTTGNNNSCLGRGCAYSNTTGSENTAMGYASLYTNVDGSDNTAIGSSALNALQSGIQNTVVGRSAGGGLNTADDVVAIGAWALTSASGGNGTVAIGAHALERSTFATHSVAIGWDANGGGSAGSENVAVGYEALESSDGIGNTVVGYQAMTTVTGFSTNFNTAIGYQAGPTTNISNSGAFGYQAKPTASNTIRIGNDSITSIGGKVGWSNLSDGRFKTAVRADVPGLRFVGRLRPVTYQWDEAKLRAFKGDAALATDGPTDIQRHTGFIAQEVEAAAKASEFEFSGVVPPANAQTPYQLSYAEFVVPLVKAVQEQQLEIERLQAAAEARPTAGTSWYAFVGCALAGALGCALCGLGFGWLRGIANQRPAARVLPT